MKLIFIKKNFLVYGGAENYMKTLLDHLKGQADIHVMAKEWIKTQGITFHSINSLTFSSFLSIITFNSNVCSKVKNTRADCVISFERTTCQDIYRAGEGCHREWLRLREMIEPGWKKYTFTLNPLHIALLRIEKKIFSGTKVIIANSNMIKYQIMNHYGIPEEKIQVIYNGVDRKRFSPINAEAYRTRTRKELSINDEACAILFVGSGFERKGLKTLLEAGSLIKSKTDLRLIVIGKGNINKFESIAKKCGVHDITHFIGTQEKIERFYAAADIFALPTIYDPFSNATLEAMASGLPAITTKNNGAAELIRNGEEGFVMEDLMDCSELAEKITLALSGRKAMGYKARLRTEEFTIEKAADEFMKILAGLIPYN